ncbi:MAG: leucine-rich repeat protein [Christensenellales bacterium]
MEITTVLKELVNKKIKDLVNDLVLIIERKSNKENYITNNKGMSDMVENENFNDIESVQAEMVEEKELNKDVSGNCKRYLQSMFVEQQMNDYAEDMWENCDRDYLDLHQGTYSHVFDNPSAVMIKSNSEYSSNLSLYRKKENAIKDKFSINLSTIKKNKQKHQQENIKSANEKIDRYRKTGVILGIIALIIGVVLGGLIFGSSSTRISLLDIYYQDAINYYSVALYIGISALVFAVIVDGTFLFLCRKHTYAKKSLQVLKIKNKNSNKNIKIKIEAKSFKARYAMGIITFLLVFIVTITGTLFYIQGVNAENSPFVYNGFEFYVRSGKAYIAGIDSVELMDTDGVPNGYCNVVIPEYVRYKGSRFEVVGIAEGAFENNGAVVTLTIGNNVTDIEDGALKNCYNLQKLILEESTSLRVNSIVNYFGVDDTVNSDQSIRKCVPKSLKTIVYKNEYTNVSSYKFKNMIDVEEIQLDLETSYIRVEAYAFENCKSLKTLDVKDGNLTDSSLKGCTGLQSLNMGYISAGTANSSGLSKLFGDTNTVPSSLTSVYISEMTYVPSYAFMNCINIESIIFPNALSIYNHAFYNCNSLQILVVEPMALASYPTSAFYGCNVLNS